VVLHPRLAGAPTALPVRVELVLVVFPHRLRAGVAGLTGHAAGHTALLLILVQTSTSSLTSGHLLVGSLVAQGAEPVPTSIESSPGRVSLGEDYERLMLMLLVPAPTGRQ